MFKEVKEVIEIIADSIILEAMPPVKRRFHIDLPSDLIGISGLFRTAGKQFYLVGGSVRDALLGKPPKDFDLATDATPNEIENILRQDQDLKIIEVGKSFGVIKTITPLGNEYEIATFRKETYAQGDTRRPDSVEFTSIDQDVSRRDLTINALFYDIEREEIVDYVGGMADIEQGTVRTVGAPEERFGEDRLRILRAIRFAGRFGSSLDPAASAAIKANNSLAGVSGERIRDEFLKGIKSAKNVTFFFNLIDTYDLWSQIFPGLKVNKEYPESKNIPVVLALLLRENTYKEVANRLNSGKYSAEEVGQVSFLVAFQGLTSETAFKFKKLFKNSRLENKDLADFSRFSGKPDPRMVATFSRYEPSITGVELQAQGLSGKELGQEMERRETEIFKKLL